METLTRSSTSAALAGSPVHWHFRALPDDVQRVTIRRLALSGLREKDIAIRTGLPEESVRRAISEDECLRTLLPELSSSGLRGHVVRAARSAL